MGLGDIDLLYQVTCFICQEVEYPPANNKKQAATWLKKHSWVKKSNKWICSACKNKRNNP